MGGGGLNYFRAHIHQRFRHTHHETKDLQPGERERERGGGGERERERENITPICFNFDLQSTCVLQLLMSRQHLTNYMCNIIRYLNLVILTDTSDLTDTHTHTHTHTHIINILTEYTTSGAQIKPTFSKKEANPRAWFLQVTEE